MKKLWIVLAVCVAPLAGLAAYTAVGGCPCEEACRCGEACPCPVGDKP